MIDNFSFIFEKWEVDNSDFHRVDTDWVWTRWNHIPKYAVGKAEAWI